MARQCTARKKDGSRCRGTPLPGKRLCFVHDPDLQQARIEGSRQGGRGKSNLERARKEIQGAVLSSVELQGLLSVAIQKVMKGTMEAGRLTAIAAAARTLMAIQEGDDLELRMQELEGKVPLGTAERERQRRGNA